MNKQILISTSIITGIGALHAIVAKKPLSKVIQGALIFSALMAILDALSPNEWGKLAGGLASLAAGVCVMVELPDVLKGMGVIK